MVRKSAESRGKVLVYHVTGKVAAEQYERVREDMKAGIAEHGKIRVLIDTTGWSGADVRVVWEDLKFTTQHLSDFERLALVGERAWQRWVARAGDYLTKAEARYFEPEQRAEALDWVNT
jgi:hypothetical protein